jgi:hypothetical protein
MAVATIPSGPDKSLLNQLDSFLFAIREKLQLSAHRHGQAEERYLGMSYAGETDGGPLSPLRPRTDPQDSMRSGAEGRLIDGPHDLDFSFGLSKSRALVEPMKLLNVFYFHLKQYVPGHGTLGFARCLHYLALHFSRPKLKSCLFSDYASFPRQTIDCCWYALDLTLDPVAYADRHTAVGA